MKVTRKNILDRMDYALVNKLRLEEEGMENSKTEVEMVIILMQIKAMETIISATRVHLAYFDKYNGGK